VYPILNVGFCEIPLTSSSEALLQYLVRERNGIPKSLATLLIDLFSNLTALTARRTVSGAIFALSFFLLYVLDIIMLPTTKLK
jgi:hypothetical protein